MRSNYWKHGREVRGKIRTDELKKKKRCSFLVCFRGDVQNALLWMNITSLFHFKRLGISRERVNLKITSAAMLTMTWSYGLSMHYSKGAEIAGVLQFMSSEKFRVQWEHTWEQASINLPPTFIPVIFASASYFHSCFVILSYRNTLSIKTYTVHTLQLRLYFQYNWTK